MARFAVGLIPFRNTPLTSAVDPVKYYEYRALGVPVLTTAFGEMPEHAKEDAGVFLVGDAASPVEILDRAMQSRPDSHWMQDFRQRNSWETRFASAGG